MRALGLIVSQGETEHMLSALLSLTFNTIYKLLKNRVLKQELLKFLQMISKFVQHFFSTFLDRYFLDTCYLPKSLYFCDLVA